MSEGGNYEKIGTEVHDSAFDVGNKPQDGGNEIIKVMEGYNGLKKRPQSPQKVKNHKNLQLNQNTNNWSERQKHSSRKMTHGDFISHQINQTQKRIRSGTRSSSRENDGLSPSLRAFSNT